MRAAVPSKKRGDECSGFGAGPDAHQGFMETARPWRKRVGRIGEILLAFAGVAE